MKTRAGSSRGSLAVTASAVLTLFAVLALVAVSRDGDDTLRITEVVSAQAHGLADGYGAHPDWIEIHNPTGDPVSLEGWGLADRDDPSDPWRFPQIAIDPDEHLVVFASGRDGRDPEGHLHTDFRVDRDGETLVLIDVDGDVVDRVPPVQLDRNHSFGRDPHDSSRWCRFLHPTPGAPNGSVCWDDERMGAPVLSMPSGFFDDPIEVAMEPTGDADEIWYTLDGSYPDLDANPDSTLVYDRPITIEDRTPMSNHLSEISVSLDSDVYPNTRRTYIPEEPVPKATVVRTRSPHGAEAVASYFVGSSVQSDLPVVSLVFEQDYLFDEDAGLFMPGSVFDEYLHGPYFDPEVSLFTPANHHMRGREWERPTTDGLHSPVWFEWCERGGACGYNTGVGVRVHGNSSRHFPRKSIRLYARDELGAPRFDAAFFGPDHPVQGHRRLILRAGGHNVGRSIIADAYLQSLMVHFEADTQASRTVTTYLNGEYWGIYNLRERYDQHYLELVHGADPETVVILDFVGLTVETGDPTGIDVYLDLLGVLADVPPESRVARERIDATMDVDSFFDFVIAHVFTGNRDWAGNNARAWRQPDGNGDGTLDGRWRWLIVDLDVAGQDRFLPTYDPLVHRLPATDDPYQGGGIPLMFDRLTRDTVYRDRFLNRFADHLNTTFLPERTVTELDELEAAIESEVPNHVSRWGAPASVDSWHAHIDRIRTFMLERPDYQWQQLLERFELEGTAMVRVRSDQTQGHVRLNSLHLRDDTPGVFDPENWAGDYFLGVPIQFEAIPADGYRFVRWEGVPTEMAETRQLTRELTGPLQLRAVFEPSGG